MEPAAVVVVVGVVEWFEMASEMSFEPDSADMKRAFDCLESHSNQVGIHLEAFELFAAVVAVVAAVVRMDWLMLENSSHYRIHIPMGCLAEDIQSQIQ